MNYFVLLFKIGFVLSTHTEAEITQIVSEYQLASETEKFDDEER